MKTSIEAVSFRDMEQDCEFRFQKDYPFWHLYTDGHKADIIFSDNEDFKSGMNLLGVCCLRSPEVKVYTFVLMNNHLHMILSGASSKVIELFDMFRLMLQRHFARSGRVVNLKDFKCQLIRIDSLQSLRNEIVYVNRNGFIVRPDCTPFSYPWGAGASFFDPCSKLLPSVTYDSLKVKQKREICRSNNIDLPSAKAMVYDGVILPSSFCNISEAESFYRSAHQYFHHISRKFEAYSEIAERLHESVFISDEEMYSAVCSLCVKIYNMKNPTQLGVKERIEMARHMHQKYNASNRQIRNILKLDNSIVETMFPQSEH